MSEVKALEGLEELHHFFRRFLVEQPLYAGRRFTVSAAGQRSDHPRFWPDSLMYRCSACGTQTTWTRLETTSRNEVPHDLPGAVTVLLEYNESFYFLLYRCAHCANERLAFWCALREMLDDDCFVVRKLGQSPAWSIDAADPIRASLPADALLFYSKGLICLSQYFGLAAVAYFRRVVEEVIDDLLDLLDQSARLDPTKLDQLTIDTVAAARVSHQASDKLKLVAEQLPSVLRPGGMNPLAKLYDAYSEGVHVLSDAESIEVALEVRTSLDFVLPGLREQLRAARDYHASITKIERRRKRSLHS